MRMCERSSCFSRAVPHLTTCSSLPRAGGRHVLVAGGRKAPLGGLPEALAQGSLSSGWSALPLETGAHPVVDQ